MVRPRRGPTGAVFVRHSNCVTCIVPFTLSQKGCASNLKGLDGPLIRGSEAGEKPEQAALVRRWKSRCGTAYCRVSGRDRFRFNYFVPCQNTIAFQPPKSAY